MNKKTILVGLLSLALITTLSDCKKSKSTSSKSMVDGKWTIAQDAIDLNGNGQMDANEIYNDTTNTTVTFNDDGTGSEAGNYLGTPISFPFTWSLVNNNQYLQLSYTASGTTSSTTAHIDNLTSSSMTLKDTTGGTASWTIFKK